MLKTTDADKLRKIFSLEMEYLHIDRSELRLESKKQHMFVAIDRVTKFTYFEFFDAATKRNGAEFLRQVIQTSPYNIHTVLTDDGAVFTEQFIFRNGVANRFGGHIFDRICYEHVLKNRLIKPYHPWVNG